jgi:branched-chain amino acid transport system substrate-binding protein
MASLLQASEKPGEEDPVLIGVIFSETGIAARHNKPLVEMIELAVDRINSKGGVLGRQIELLLLDNKSTPIGALEAASEAVAAHVTAVIGAHWSSHSLAMAPLLQKEGIPMISPGSTNPAVTMGRNYVFRACFIDSMQGMAMARFASQELKVKTTAVLHNIDEQYSIALADYFGRAFSAYGGKVVHDAGYRGDATDFSAIIKQLLVIQPEAVYIPGYTRDTALFMKQARRMGLKATFLGGDGWDLLGNLITDAVEGSYQTVAWHPDVPYPESRVMQELYMERHDNAEIQNLTTPLAYDAVMLLVDAIRRAGATEPARVRAALAATRDFPGATGPITFDDNGDPVGKEIIIVKYLHGTTVFTAAVKPQP